MTTVPRILRGRAGRRRHLGAVHGALVPFAWGLAIFDIAVLVWMVLSSLKTTREMVLDPFGLPAQLQWGNYAEAWNSGQFGNGIVNSVILVVASGVGCILLAAPAAYALSRFKARGANALTMFFILGLGIPAQTTFLPLYVAFDRIGLVDSLTGLCLIYIGTGIPYALFLLTAFFRSLPNELEEAAALDGAGPVRTFWQIMLPMTRSGLITIFILQAIGHWGETFFALVMLQSQSTLSLSILRFTQTMQYTGNQWSVLMAGLVMVIIPLLVVYIWTGRRVIEGIGAGYSK